MYSKLYFATPGIPASSSGKGTAFGIEHTAALGIDALELEFVHSIYLNEEKARQVGEVASRVGVELTIHGPYTLNLHSLKPGISEMSVSRIIQCARVGSAAGARSVTFHPAFYLKVDPEDVYQIVRQGLEQVMSVVRKEQLSVAISPETTGKPTQFGSLEELVRLCKEIEGLRFCLDFAHLHARSNGKYNSAAEFRAILDYISDELGEDFLQSMHMHYSGLTYSEKGERAHLPFLESDAAYMDLMIVLKEYGVKGILTVESPLQEQDVLFLRGLYDQC